MHKTPLQHNANFEIRKRIIEPTSKRVKIANLTGTIQSNDNYTNINCEGYGRVRNFKKFLLFLDNDVNGYGKALWRGHPQTSNLRSQVFQLAGCNWRCWYCFVDDAMLSGCESCSDFLSATELMDLYCFGSA